MTRTCYDEFYGVGIDSAIAANYVLRLQFGENGANFYCLRPSVAALEARLPLAGFARKWDRITVANHGAHSLLVKDVLGTTIATLTVGQRGTFTLIDTTTLWGTWVTRVTTSSIGTTLVHDRESLTVLFDKWVGNGINLRSYCEDVFGYDGVKPASIYCRLGNNIVVGSETTAEPAFDTGTWPAGSTLLLEIADQPSQIIGIGGRGGNGQSAPVVINPQDGFPGGDALVVRVNTALVNYGAISGGGGGGGGGNHSVPNARGGGGGGGGSGYQVSLGGNGGLGGGTLANGATGGSGTIGVGGIGGAGGHAGGNGGGHGTAGSAGSGFSGGLGGAPGNAIKRLSTVTLTKIVAGVIRGPEVTF